MSINPLVICDDLRTFDDKPYTVNTKKRNRLKLSAFCLLLIHSLSRGESFDILIRVN